MGSRNVARCFACPEEVDGQVQGHKAKADWEEEATELLGLRVLW